MGELLLLTKPSHIRVGQAEIVMETVVVIVDMTVIVAVPLVGEVQVVEIASNAASLDILQGSVLQKVVEMVGEGTAPGMIGTVQRRIGTVQRRIGTVQRRIGTVQRMIGTAQRMIGMVQRMIGMVVGKVEVVAMDLTAVENALEDVAAGMVAAVELQEVRGTVVLHTTAQELVAFTRILLQRLKKRKASAFCFLVKCEVKVKVDGLFSSMYLDSSRKKMCLYFGHKLKSRLCSKVLSPFDMLIAMETLCLVRLRHNLRCATLCLT